MNLDKCIREVKDTDFVLDFIKQKRKIYIFYSKEGFGILSETYFDEDRRIMVSDGHITIYHGGPYSLGYVSIPLREKNIERIIYNNSEYGIERCVIYYKNNDKLGICY